MAATGKSSDEADFESPELFFGPGVAAFPDADTGCSIDWISRRHHVPRERGHLCLELRSRGVHDYLPQTAVIDYTLNNSKAYFYQKTKNIEAIDPLLTPAIEQIWTQKGTPAAVLNALAAKLNDGILQGRYPTPKLS